MSAELSIASKLKEASRKALDDQELKDRELARTYIKKCYAEAHKGGREIRVTEMPMLTKLELEREELIVEQRQSGPNEYETIIRW